MARTQGATDRQKRKGVPSAASLLDECRARFRKRVGREWTDADREHLRAAIGRDEAAMREVQATCAAIRHLRGAPDLFDREGVLSRFTRALRALVDEYKGDLDSFADIRWRHSPRAVLLYEVDVESFFGTGKPATVLDLAVVSVLAGVADIPPMRSHASLKPAKILDDERATLAKLRAEHGLLGRRDLVAKLRAVTGGA